MANSPIKTRLSLHKNWKNDLPLKSLWTIDFATRDGGDTATLGKRVNAVFNQYERREARDWRIEESLIKDHTDSSGENGYLLAQSIAFPTENYGISTGDDLVGSGGYLRGYISENRASYGSQNKLDITFLETNIDIIDYFIKPWIIASSHKGLIEDGNTNQDIKCNVTVALYTRDKNAGSSATGKFNYANSKLELRKKIIFFNVVPFTVVGDQVSYGDISYNELTKTVGFAFSHYNTVELNDGRAAPKGIAATIGPAAPVIKSPTIDSPEFVGPTQFIGPPQTNPAATYFDRPAIPNLLDGFTPTPAPGAPLLPPPAIPSSAIPNPAATIRGGRFGGPFGNGIQPLPQPNPAATFRVDPNALPDVPLT